MNHAQTNEINGLPSMFNGQNDNLFSKKRKERKMLYTRMYVYVCLYTRIYAQHAYFVCRKMQLYKCIAYNSETYNLCTTYTFHMWWKLMKKYVQPSEKKERMKTYMFLCEHFMPLASMLLLLLTTTFTCLDFVSVERLNCILYTQFVTYRIHHVLAQNFHSLIICALWRICNMF